MTNIFIHHMTAQRDTRAVDIGTVDGAIQIMPALGPSATGLGMYLARTGLPEYDLADLAYAIGSGSNFNQLNRVMKRLARFGILQLQAPTRDLEVVMQFNHFVVPPVPHKEHANAK
jgi:hypothetical protein